jgi:lipopolysaccharide exporter
MLAGLLLFARPVIALYLGPQWELAGEILVILAPMLAIKSVTMSLATTVFVLKKPAWLLWHNVANFSAIGLAAIIAWHSHSGLLGFLKALALLQGLEYALFGAVFTRAVWQQRQDRLARSIGEAA